MEYPRHPVFFGLVPFVCFLTFELDKKDDKLEIHGNNEGLKYLANILSSMAEKQSADNVNLMIVDWGGNLSSELQCTSNELIKHVEIFLWPNQ